MTTPAELMNQAANEIRNAWDHYFAGGETGSRPSIEALFLTWADRIPEKRLPDLLERMLDAEVYARYRDTDSPERDEYYDCAAFQPVSGYRDIVDRVFDHLSTVVHEDCNDPLPAIKATLERIASAKVGTVLGERFEVIRSLDRGAFGATLVVRDAELQRLVVLKVPCPRRWPDNIGKTRRRVDPYYEAKSHAPHDGHPNIVKLLDVYAPKVDRNIRGVAWLKEFWEQLRTSEMCWIVMEYVEGQSLRKRLVQEQEGRLRSREAAHIMASVGDALAHAHKLEEGRKPRVLHRDLKPDNILLDTNGVSKLADFGLAVVYDDQITGERAGTLEYMSPRQLAGKKLGLKDEIWSLGVILYEALTGIRPFTSNATNDGVRISELRKRTREPHIPAVQVGKDKGFNVDIELSNICEKCFDVRNGEGFSTAGEFASALAAWLETAGATGSSDVQLEESRAAEKRRLIATANVEPSSKPKGERAEPEADDETSCIAASGILPFLAEVCRDGKLVLVVGHGFSAAAGLQVRERLLERFKKEIKKTSTGLDDLVGLADTYLSDLEKDMPSSLLARRKLVSVIAEVLDECEVEHGGREFGTLYERVASLPINTFFTSTWDKLLQRCLRQLGQLPCEVYDAAFVPPCSPEPERHVIYLHGRLESAEKHVIVTGNDFFEYQTDGKAAAVYNRLVEELAVGKTLLCLGWDLKDLRRAEYLCDALKAAGQKRLGIYAVLPSLSPSDARQLLQRDHIVPVTLECAPSQGELATANFLDVLAKLTSGSHATYERPPIPVEHVPTPQEVSADEYSRLTGGARDRLEIEGFDSPGDWFVNLPAGDLPRPDRPPAHSLLKKVFVDRHPSLFELDGVSLKEWVKAKLREGGMAGITGLLGLGGVGKTYLAQRVAWELNKDEGWDIVWVSLHERSTEEAIDAVANAYGGLRFSDALQTGEKLLAIEWLFEQVHNDGRCTLVVLDNAERFPNLPLLLRPLMRVPVLVTSRIEECNDKITYRRLRPMTDDESMELCELFLNDQDEDRFRRLPPEDREDLQALCKALGGHPLGITMALTGYLNLPLRQRGKKGLFANVLRRIEREGVAPLEEATVLDTGQAGENIHRSVFSTFEWLFSQLPDFEDRPGASAKLLLPIVAIFATIPVDAELIATAIRKLLDRCNEAAKKPPKSGADDAQPATVSVDASAPSDDTISSETSAETELADSERSPQELRPAWLDDLAVLTDATTLNEALDLLSHVSLLDVEEGTDRVVMHPLIREFAFTERSNAKPLSIADERSQDLTVDGPSLLALFSCGVDVMQGSADNAESLLDLIPRLRHRARALAEPACKALHSLFHKLYWGEEADWPLAREVAETAVELARDVDLSEWHGRMLAELGELLDRMEEPDGIVQMGEALELLRETKDVNVFREFVWARQHYQKNSPADAGLQHHKAITMELRDVLSDHRIHDKDHTATISSIEGHLRIHSDPIACSFQLGLSSSTSSFLPNCVEDLQRWLQLCSEGRAEQQPRETADLLGSVATERSNNGKSSKDALTPGRWTEFRSDILAYTCLCDETPSADVEQCFDDILAHAKKCGIRGFYVQAMRNYRNCTMAIMNGDWAKASCHAELWRDSRAIAARNRAEFAVILPRILAIALTLAKGSNDETQLTMHRDELAQIEERCEHWGRNELLGWLLLARALLHTQDQANAKAAVRYLAQARRSFALYTPCMPEPAEKLHARVVQLVNSERPQYEALREKLSEADVRPPDFRPWLIDRKRDDEHRLPQRVRCRQDGKTMRLVESGLQPGPLDREMWLYPFYIDEEPVSVDEFARYAAETDLRCIVDGEKSGLAVASDRAYARAYAEWAGKQLPNLHEWYAATWQHGGRHEPEQWWKWDQARDRMIDRIERGIRDQVKNHDNPIPIREYAVTDAEKRAQIEYFLDARWITDSPALSQLIEERIVARVVEHLESINSDDATEFAMGLAVTASLQRDERFRYVKAISKLSEFKVREIVKILNEEKAKWLDLDETHYDALLGIFHAFRADFIRLLVDDLAPAPEAIDAEEVFGPDGPGPLSRSNADEAIPQNPFIAGVTAGELDSVWSGMTGDDDDRKPGTLWGDPLTHAEWIKNGMIRAGLAGNWNIGIRCVLPLFTAQDFDLVEPIPDSTS